MKRFLVFYEKEWQKNELTAFKRLDSRINCVYAKRDFKDAKYIETKEGSKIDEAWLLRTGVLNQGYIDSYDGLVIVLEGERLKGRNGVHTKKTYNGKRFSLIQMEAKKGVYRTWKQNKDKTWYLDSVRRRGDYKQILYTFEHEIGHALCWLKGVYDSLHLFVKHKNYELWWEVTKI